jgi:hypothetical protein
MRTALHNGYSNVATLCRALKIPCYKDALELLTEHSPLFNVLKKESPNLDHILMNNLYTMIDTNKTRWSIDEIELHRPKFSRTFKYCPLCLQDEIITIFQDIKDLEICPIHDIRTVDKCPKCGHTEWWPEANMLQCKCGFERKQSDWSTAELFDKNSFEVYGEKSHIKKLSTIIETLKTCEDIWKSRKLSNEQNLNLSEQVIKHVEKMARNQAANLPGFTNRMLAAPWIESHNLLKETALKVFDEYQNYANTCSTDGCCSEISLSKYELYYSLGSRKILPEHATLLFDEDAKQYNPTNDRQPICERVKFIIRLKQQRKLQYDQFILNNYTTSKVKKLIHCNEKTLKSLIELGYLQLNRYKLDMEEQSTIMICKESALKFHKKHILLKEVSETLQLPPSNAARLLADFNITPETPSPIPKLYNRDEFNAKINFLRNNLTTPPPNPNKRLTEDFTTLSLIQAACSLEISIAILHRRFIRSRLIEPLTMNGTLRLSNSQIIIIRAHLKQNLTVEQSSSLLDCSRKKFGKLLTKYHVEPSYRIHATTTNWQLLYNIEDIRRILQLEKSLNHSAEKSKIVPF